MHAKIFMVSAKKNIKNQFKINLSGLEDGEHMYSYHLGQDFFDAFQYAEFDKADIDVNLRLSKHGNLMRVEMDSKGKVELPDDRTGEPYIQSLEGNMNFVLQYGEKYNDDDDELIIIPFHSPYFNPAQQIYEMVVLSVPMKRLDPSQPEPLLPEENEAEKIDPRWNKLKNLLNNKTE